MKIKDKVEINICGGVFEGLTGRVVDIRLEHPLPYLVEFDDPEAEIRGWPDAWFEEEELDACG